MQELHTNEESSTSQYRIWRKNAPYLYNIVYSQQLSSPSLTAQWLPENLSFPNDGYNTCKVIYGSNLESNNQIIVARVKIPLQTNGANQANQTNKSQCIGLVEEMRDEKVCTLATIPHNGPICRARCNPYKNNQIASKS